MAPTDNPEGALRVLLVDDEPDWRFLIEAVFGVQGWSVRAVASGREALAVLASQRPDVVVLDLRLPDLTGCEVIEELRAQPRWADVPIVVCTACAEPDAQAQAWEAGCDVYLVKPCSIEEVADEVGRMASMTPEARRAHRAHRALRVGDV